MYDGLALYGRVYCIFWCKWTFFFSTDLDEQIHLSFFFFICDICRVPALRCVVCERFNRARLQNNYIALAIQG